MSLNERQQVLEMLDGLRTHRDDVYAVGLAALRAYGLDRVFSVLPDILYRHPSKDDTVKTPIRLQAIKATVDLDRECGINLVLPLLNDPDSLVLSAASEAIRAAGGDPRLVSTLLEIVQGDNLEVRPFAIRELGRTGDRKLLDVMRPYLTDPDGNVRASTVTALFYLDSVLAIELAMPLLEDPEYFVRWHVCGCLYDFGDERAVAPLLNRLETDPDPQVRLTAAEALGSCGNPGVLAQLYRAKLADAGIDQLGYTVKHSAAEAISNILLRAVLKELNLNILPEYHLVGPDGAQITIYTEPRLPDTVRGYLQDYNVHPAILNRLASESTPMLGVTIGVMHSAYVIRRVFILSHANIDWVVELKFDPGQDPEYRSL